ncbi:MULTISPECIES: DUF1045 domain-containing protein [Falsihalocynthiibacter]|uniref:DUF1045 domain-containing protein n=1 Tax=Falsihalocynthiibacter TaxID=2854182 RepID=UPI0030025390
MLFNRYSIFMTPEAGMFADSGAAWLGWDLEKGCAVPHPKASETALRIATQAPRKYGFHGTIKPPFHLAKGTTYESLLSQTKALCAVHAPVEIEALSLTIDKSTLALTPEGNIDHLASLAAAVLQKLDRFRAPLSETELAGRRKANLTPLQETNLKNWGYPYVLDAFKFHITLSGHLPPKDLEHLEALARTHFAHNLGRPMPFCSLILAGEAGDGRFHALHRLPLSGKKVP